MYQIKQRINSESTVVIVVKVFYFTDILRLSMVIINLGCMKNYEKLKYFTPLCPLVSAYQGVRNINFLEILHSL